MCFAFIFRIIFFTEKIWRKLVGVKCCFLIVYTSMTVCLSVGVLSTNSVRNMKYFCFFCNFLPSEFLQTKSYTAKTKCGLLLETYKDDLSDNKAELSWYFWVIASIGYTDKSWKWKLWRNQGIDCLWQQCLQDKIFEFNFFDNLDTAIEWLLSIKSILDLKVLNV